MSWSGVMLSLLSAHLISLTHLWLGLQSETNKHRGSSWKKITVRQLSDWAEFLRQRHPTPWGTRVCASQVYSSLLCLLHNESFTSPVLSTAFLWRQQSEWKDFKVMWALQDTPWFKVYIRQTHGHCSAFCCIKTILKESCLESITHPVLWTITRSHNPEARRKRVLKMHRWMDVYLCMFSLLHSIRCVPATAG